MTLARSKWFNLSIWLLALGPGVYAVQLLWLLIAGRMTNSMLRPDYSAISVIIFIGVAAVCVRWRWSGIILCMTLAAGFAVAYILGFSVRMNGAQEMLIDFVRSGLPLIFPWVMVMMLARPLAHRLLRRGLAPLNES